MMPDKDSICMICLFAIVFSVIPCSASHAAQATAVLAHPGGSVAATPIAIPRPIHLQRIRQFPIIDSGSSQNTASTAPSHDVIKACDLVGIQGNALTLRVHYRVNPDRARPIYAGAWLYDANGQSIDAGYKPVAIARPDAGAVDVVLVLPKASFRSAYVDAFLMESGKPVFTNGRFRMAYNWAKGVLSATNSAVAASGNKRISANLQDNRSFCEAYARRAVAQYDYAMANKLHGIVPPVWSSDSASHYNWCLRVPRQDATQGAELRQSKIDRYKYQHTGQMKERMVQPVDNRINKRALPALDPGQGDHSLDSRLGGNVAATPIAIPKPGPPTVGGATPGSNVAATPIAIPRPQLNINVPVTVPKPIPPPVAHPQQ